MREPRQVLIVAPAWVGDMVMAHVLIQILRRRYPRLMIDVLAPGWAADLARRMPEVRQVHTLDIGHGELRFAARRRVADSLRPHAYDWSIVLPNSWKSALIPYWAKIRRRSGYLGEWRYGLLTERRKLDKKRLPRTIERFAHLALATFVPIPSPLPAPALRVDEDARAAALAKLGLAMPDKPVLALAPGAEFGPAKRWPIHHYQELAREKIAAGWDVWLFGSPNDASLTQALAEAVPGTVDLGGKTTLLEALDLLSLAAVTVSNDSGLMHVAGAVGSRVIGLFGSSDPAMTPPLGPQAQILFQDMACRPCGKRHCPLKHHRCMEDLAVSDVVQAMARYDIHSGPL